MERIRLPREVAEAIDNARQLGFKNVRIIDNSFKVEDKGPYRNAIRDFAADNFDLFLQALVNGYEVYEDREDVAIQWCLKRGCIARGFSEHDVVMTIKSILEKGSPQ